MTSVSLLHCLFVCTIIQNVLSRWLVPIYNDTYVMLFFGMLQQLISSFLSVDIKEVWCVFMYACQA